MLEGLHAFFNSNRNPHLTFPLLLVSNSTMFNPSYTSSSGSKSPLEGAWNPLSFIPRGCSSPNSTVQGLPLLVVNHISSPSPIGMLDPTILFSSTTFDLSAPFFHVVIGLQNFQDHEPYIMLLICLIFNLTYLIKSKGSLNEE